MSSAEIDEYGNIDNLCSGTPVHVSNDLDNFDGSILSVRNRCIKALPFLFIEPRIALWLKLLSESSIDRIDEIKLVLDHNRRLMMNSESADLDFSVSERISYSQACWSKVVLTWIASKRPILVIDWETEAFRALDLKCPQIRIKILANMHDLLRDFERC